MKKILMMITPLALITSNFALPAFPGAEGFGAETPGGRGGQVIQVTNLNASGPGSFKAAMLTPGPRIIVFRVSGVIDLGSSQYENISLGPDNLSYVTVAGQTSPGSITLTSPSGTTIGSSYTSTRFHDMVLRFIRCRIIRETGGNGGDQSFGQYQAHDFIVDHCDFSGGDDEVFDIGYSRHWTVQWCTMSNSGPGGQQYGPLIAYTNPSGGYPLSRLTLHHNLIANHSKRGPEFHWLWHDIPDSGKVDFRSNVIYQVVQYGTAFWGVADSEFLQLNLVGNYWKNGPLDYEWAVKVNAEPGVRVYIKGNHWETTPGGRAQAKSYGLLDPNDPDTVLNVQYGKQPVLVGTPWNFPPVTTHTAQQAYDTVLARAGAWPRDSMNRRTVNEVWTRTGDLGRCYDPNITSGPAAPADADNDGMPDFWETGMGLNPSSAADNILDKDGDGYTNIEEYINDLALARLCQDYYNPVYPIPSNWPDYNPSCAKSMSVESSRLETPSVAAISISPNPLVEGIAGISLSGARAFQGNVQIVDAAGKKVAAFSASGRLSLNGTGIPAGLYLVRWTDGGRLMAQKRLVVTH